MLKQALLVSGKKPNTAPALSAGLKLEPSGLQKGSETFGEGRDSLASGCLSPCTCREGRLAGRRAHARVGARTRGKPGDWLGRRDAQQDA